MPATDYYHQSSSLPLPKFGRSSILSTRRNQIHSMEPTHEPTSLEIELESFQRHVADQFHGLSESDSGEELLSLSWVGNLLDAFLCCHEEFKMVMFNNIDLLKKSPMDRLVSEFHDKSLKGLDICNAIRDGFDQIRDWNKQIEIVVSSLQKGLGLGQIRRANKALIELSISMVDDKEVNSDRRASFGRNYGKKVDKSMANFNFRSLSSVSRTWSAAKQLQAIASTLVLPRMNEVISTNGLATAVYTMSSVLMFVTWALVAAIPCQDRGLHTHFTIPKQFVWAGPILSLHEKILDESKQRSRRNSLGLLDEIHQIEVCARGISELTDSEKFPLTECNERELRMRVEELGRVREVVSNGLKPLECKLREVFRRIARSRIEGI